jgi:hypothetical protein
MFRLVKLPYERRYAVPLIEFRSLVYRFKLGTLKICKHES